MRTLRGQFGSQPFCQLFDLLQISIQVFRQLSVRHLVNLLGNALRELGQLCRFLAKLRQFGGLASLSARHWRFEGGVRPTAVVLLQYRDNGAKREGAFRPPLLSRLIVSRARTSRGMITGGRAADRPSLDYRCCRKSDSSDPYPACRAAASRDSKPVRCCPRVCR
jgi:hypothetical protein